MQGTLVGEIKLMAADSAPANCLACDGSAVSRTTYAELFGVIGTTWGSGDGSTTFNLPDLRDEWLLFAGSSHSVGADVAAGLPNIQGYLTTRPTTTGVSSGQNAGSSAFWSNYIDDAPDLDGGNAFLYGSNIPGGGGPESSMFPAPLLGGILQGTTVSATGIVAYAGLYFFDASSANSVYGNASTVQPQSRALAPYIVYAA